MIMPLPDREEGWVWIDVSPPSSGPQAMPDPQRTLTMY